MKTKINSDIWIDDDFVDAPPEIKLVWLWLLTNRCCNAIGVVTRVSEKRFTRETGLDGKWLTEFLQAAQNDNPPSTPLEGALSSLSLKIVINPPSTPLQGGLRDGCVAILNYIDYQWGSDYRKVASNACSKAIIDQLGSLPAGPVRVALHSKYADLIRYGANVKHGRPFNEDKAAAADDSGKESDNPPSRGVNSQPALPLEKASKEKEKEKEYSLEVGVQGEETFAMGEIPSLEDYHAAAAVAGVPPEVATEDFYWLAQRSFEIARGHKLTRGNMALRLAWKRNQSVISGYPGVPKQNGAAVVRVGGESRDDVLSELQWQTDPQRREQLLAKLKKLDR